MPTYMHSWPQIVSTREICRFVLLFALLLFGANSNADQLSSLNFSQEKQAILDPNTSPARRLELFVVAIDDATIDSLQVLSPEFLKQIPGNFNQLIHGIKKEALVGMLSRFTADDWKSWPYSSKNVYGNPTQARLYVDDLLVINQELGVYLETAAQIFHLLYRYTLAGKVFDEDLAVDLLVSKADMFLASRANTRMSPRKLLTRTITKDSSFIEVFEDIRAELIVFYAEEFPKEKLKHLELMTSVKPDLSGKRIDSLFLNLISSLATKLSPESRLSLLTSAKYIEMFNRFVAKSAVMKKPLGSLYLTGALDAFKAGDLGLAKILLKSSKELHPNLEMRGQVEQIVLRSLDQKKEIVQNVQVVKADSVSASSLRVGDVPKKTNNKLQLFGKPNAEQAQKPKEEGGGSSWVTNLFFATIGFIVIALIIFAIVNRNTSSEKIPERFRDSGSYRFDDDVEDFEDLDSRDDEFTSSGGTYAFDELEADVVGK